MSCGYYHLLIDFPSILAISTMSVVSLTLLSLSRWWPERWICLSPWLWVYDTLRNQSNFGFLFILHWFFQIPTFRFSQSSISIRWVLTTELRIKCSCLHYWSTATSERRPRSPWKTIRRQSTTRCATNYRPNITRTCNLLFSSRKKSDQSPISI